MAAAIDTIAESYELPRKPAVDEVFSRAFLPGKADRTPQALSQ